MRQLKITNKITNRESVALEKYLNDIKVMRIFNQGRNELNFNTHAVIFRLILERDQCNSLELHPTWHQSSSRKDHMTNRSMFLPLDA